MSNAIEGVQATTTTTGTGSIALDGTPPGRRSMSEAETAGDYVSGTTYYYSIVDGAEWEYGSGTITGSGSYTLTRSVTRSSNSDAAIDLSGSGIPVLTFALPDAVKLVDSDLTGNGGAILTNDEDITTTGSVTASGDITGESVTASGTTAPSLTAKSVVTSGDVGLAEFVGRNDAAEDVTYASVAGFALDDTDGAEKGRLVLAVPGQEVWVSEDGLSKGSTSNSLVYTIRSEVAVRQLVKADGDNAVVALDFSVDIGDYPVYEFVLFNVKPFTGSDELGIRSGASGVDASASDYQTRFVLSSSSETTYISPFDASLSNSISGTVRLYLRTADKARWTFHLQSESTNTAIGSGMSLDTSASSIDTVRFFFAGGAAFSSLSRVIAYGIRGVS